MVSAALSGMARASHSLMPAAVGCMPLSSANTERTASMMRPPAAMATQDTGPLT